ncbi:MAG: LuxR C-terminal-related transcriptional regulator, partial [Dehalococcoidia bacterium]
LDLSPEDVAALEGRTEGWIAGLQLAALSMQGRDDTQAFVSAFAGNDRYVVDYLLEEVLQRQPAHARDFLQATSILDRLCGPLCDALTGRADGTATLEELDRANLFVVPLDGRRRWYRYHHLFADVLRAHLTSEARDSLGDLHRRASDWYLGEGQMSEAIVHALASGDHEHAAELIESVAREMVRAYRPLQLLEWLRQLPDEVVERHPLLCAYYSFGLFPAGEMEAATRWLDVASGLVEGASAAGDLEGDELGSLLGVIAVARGYHAMATGDVAATIEHSQRALEVLPESEPTWRAGSALLLALAPWRTGDLEAAAEAHAQGVAGLERAGDAALAVSSIYDAGKLAVWRGRLREARRHYERALELWESAGDPLMPGAADAYLGLAALDVEHGDLDAARGHQRLAEELAEQALLPETLSRLVIGRARLHEAARDLDAAMADLDEAESLVVPATVPSLPVHALRARVMLRAGRVADVEAWASEHNLVAHQPVAYPREFEHLTLARLLIERTRASGELKDARNAVDLLARLLEAARGLRGGSVLEILVLQSLAYEALGDDEAAMEPFAEALRLAEPEGYCRMFVAEGEPMRGLLRSAIALGHSTAYATSLLDALGEGDASDGRASTGASVLPEPLTAREVEILRLIAAGMRNQQIADHLVISVATVKRHIANAYGKLGVTHRTEAIVRANELRVL